MLAANSHPDSRLSRKAYWKPSTVPFSPCLNSTSLPFFEVHPILSPINTSPSVSDSELFEIESNYQDPSHSVHSKEDDSSSFSDPDAKPIHSYGTLISKAINSRHPHKLTLSDIYSWIQNRYPFFKQAGQGWKNAIRHNLSLDKSFKRVKRPSNEPGRGSYWTLDEEAIAAAGVSRPGTLKPNRRRRRSSTKPGKATSRIPKTTIKHHDKSFIISNSLQLQSSSNSSLTSLSHSTARFPSFEKNPYEMTTTKNTPSPPTTTATATVITKKNGDYSLPSYQEEYLDNDSFSLLKSPGLLRDSMYPSGDGSHQLDLERTQNGTTSFLPNPCIPLSHSILPTNSLPPSYLFNRSDLDSHHFDELESFSSLRPHSEESSDSSLSPFLERSNSSKYYNSSSSLLLPMSNLQFYHHSLGLESCSSSNLPIPSESLFSIGSSSTYLLNGHDMDHYSTSTTYYHSHAHLYNHRIAQVDSHSCHPSLLSPIPAPSLKLIRETSSSNSMEDSSCLDDSTYCPFSPSSIYLPPILMNLNEIEEGREDESSFL